MRARPRAGEDWRSHPVLRPTAQRKRPGSAPFHASLKVSHMEAHAVADIFDRGDALGPGKVVHVCEPSVGLRAVLVIDNVARGPAVTGMNAGERSGLAEFAGAGISFAVAQEPGSGPSHRDATVPGPAATSFSRGRRRNR